MTITVKRALGTLLVGVSLCDWGASTAVAQTGDVIDSAAASIVGKTQCAGQAVVIWTDTNNGGKLDTLVVLTTVAGNGGIVDTQSSQHYIYAFSYVACGKTSNDPSDPGQVVIHFVDALDPGFVWNNAATWKYKAVPSVSVDADWSGGLVCPRKNTPSPYFRVQAYKDVQQSGEITGVQSSVPGNWTRSAFADPAGVKEVYVHTDFCENSLNNLIIGAATIPPSGKPAIVKNPGDDQEYQGMTTSLSVTAQGASPLSYQWYKSGKPVQNVTAKGAGASQQHSISGATTDTLTIGNLVRLDTGSYTVTVTNTLGSVTSTPAQLTVMPPCKGTRCQ
jgi:hypothetical protein